MEMLGHVLRAVRKKYELKEGLEIADLQKTTV